jgi:hypothetical protein
VVRPVARPLRTRGEGERLVVPAALVTVPLTKAPSSRAIHRGTGGSRQLRDPRRRRRRPPRDPCWSVAASA